MAAAKSTSPSPLRLLLVVAAVLLAWQSQVARSQDCAAHIGQLMSCAPYLVPGGAGSPNQECCGSVANINQTCACSALDIISRLPALCHVPAITCAST